MENRNEKNDAARMQVLAENSKSCKNILIIPVITLRCNRIISMQAIGGRGRMIVIIIITIFLNCIVAGHS